MQHGLQKLPFGVTRVSLPVESSWSSITALLAARQRQFALLQRELNDHRQSK